MTLEDILGEQKLKAGKIYEEDPLSKEFRL